VILLWIAGCMFTLGAISSQIEDELRGEGFWSRCFLVPFLVAGVFAFWPVCLGAILLDPIESSRHRHVFPPQPTSKDEL
jgi:hypothetical protein